MCNPPEGGFLKLILQHVCDWNVDGITLIADRQLDIWIASELNLDLSLTHLNLEL